MISNDFAERVARRNRRNPAPGPLRAARTARRVDIQDLLHASRSEGSWKQPGRRFGPSPFGPDRPKANKVTDRDGNPRIAPLPTDSRWARYTKQTGRSITQEGADAMHGSPLWLSAQRPEERARMLGLTPRQRRRLDHKDSHTTSPVFGRRAR